MPRSFRSVIREPISKEEGRKEGERGRITDISKFDPTELSKESREVDKKSIETLRSETSKPKIDDVFNKGTLQQLPSAIDRKPDVITEEKKKSYSARFNSSNLQNLSTEFNVRVKSITELLEIIKSGIKVKESILPKESTIAEIIESEGKTREQVIEDFKAKGKEEITKVKDNYRSLLTIEKRLLDSKTDDQVFNVLYEFESNSIQILRFLRGVTPSKDYIFIERKIRSAIEKAKSTAGLLNLLELMVLRKRLNLSLGYLGMKQRMER